ncbi:MAG: CoA-binding protein [Alphaproteobacteria bacterium]
MDDALLMDILGSVHTIAMIGASPKPQRPSNDVMRFLQEKGYRVIPVNPGHAGSEINGETVYARLADIPVDIDMVDIFRQSGAIGEIIDKTIDLASEKQIRVIWTQLGVIDRHAGGRAEAAGLTVVMDHCPKIEYQRLM